MLTRAAFWVVQSSVTSPPPSGRYDGTAAITPCGGVMTCSTRTSWLMTSVSVGLVSVSVNVVDRSTRAAREPDRLTGPMPLSRTAPTAFCDDQFRTTSPPPDGREDGATANEPLISGGVGSTATRTEYGMERTPLLSVKVKMVGDVTRTVLEPLRGTSPMFWSITAPMALVEVQLRTTSPPP